MANVQPGVWGIDLGQCALKAIRLEMRDGKVAATHFDYIEHPKILNQPDADPDQLTREALEQFLSRNTLKGDTVVISVPGQSGLARFVKLPPVEEKKIAEIVKFEAKQQIPFPLEEVVWDFQKIGSGIVTDGFALETEIGLFAMKRDMIARYMQHFSDVNVEVHIVQMAPLGLCNFITYDLLGKDVVAEGEEEDSGKSESIVALDIGTDSSNLVITDAGKVIWQRPIPFGGNHFTRALTKDLKLTFAKAEHIKRNAVKSPDLKKILAALKPVLNDFVGEVQRSLGYFTNTHRDAQIKYMIGLGNAFRLPGLQKFLQEKLQLEVRKLAKLERCEGDDVVNAPQFTENILSFAVAYGLALQGLSKTRLQTNLLPSEIRVERMIRAKKPWAAAAAAAILLAAAGLTFGRHLEYSAVNDESIKTAIDAGKKTIGEIGTYRSNYDAEVARIKQSQDIIRAIGAGVEERFNWQQLFQFVNEAIPKPNGEKVPPTSRFGGEPIRKYVTAQAKWAFGKIDEKRFKRGLEPPPKGMKPALVKQKAIQEEEDIKKSLIQINIDGVSTMYSSDLVAAGFYDALQRYKPRLDTMDPEEKDMILNKKDQLPKKGWVVEIRGYTFHKDQVFFVRDTFLENLAKPHGVGNKYPPALAPAEPPKEGPGAPPAPAPAPAAAPGADGKKEEPVVAAAPVGPTKRVGFVFLLTEAVVPDPQPGQFQIIRSSLLPSLLTSVGFGAGPGGEGGMPGPGGRPEGSGGMPGPGIPGPGLPGGGMPGATGRESWKPVGEIASQILSGAGGAGMPPGGAGPGVGAGVGVGQGGTSPFGGSTPPAPGEGGTTTTVTPQITRQPRTEFVIVFIWQEPTSDPEPVAPTTADPSTEQPPPP